MVTLRHVPLSDLALVPVLVLDLALVSLLAQRTGMVRFPRLGLTLGLGLGREMILGSMSGRSNLAPVPGLEPELGLAPVPGLAPEIVLALETVPEQGLAPRFGIGSKLRLG